MLLSICSLLFLAFAYFNIWINFTSNTVIVLSLCFVCPDAEKALVFVDYWHAYGIEHHSRNPFWSRLCFGKFLFLHQSTVPSSRITVICWNWWYWFKSWYNGFFPRCKVMVNCNSLHMHFPKHIRGPHPRSQLIHWSLALLATQQTIHLFYDYINVDQLMQLLGAIAKTYF